MTAEDYIASVVDIQAENAWNQQFAECDTEANYDRYEMTWEEAAELAADAAIEDMLDMGEL